MYEIYTLFLHYFYTFIPTTLLIPMFEFIPIF